MLKVWLAWLEPIREAWPIRVCRCQMLSSSVTKLEVKSFLLLPNVHRSLVPFKSFSKPRLLSTTASWGKMCDKLKFDNRILRSLPIDKETNNYRRTVAGHNGFVNNNYSLTNATVCIIMCRLTGIR